MAHILRHATLWHDDHPAEGLPDEYIRQDGDVTWLDLDFGVSALEAHAAVAPYCDERLTAAQIASVLSPSEDRTPRSWANGDIRLTRAFAVAAIPTDETVGRLVFQPVHILSGEGWVITCWQTDEDVLPTSHCLDAVERRWVAGVGRSAADLAVLILHELVLTYSPAYRGIESWLEEWELELYRDDQLDRDSLPKLWTAMAELRDWVKPLNRPGVRSDVDKAWFRGASDHDEIDSVDDRINRALHDLSELGRILRSSFAMLQDRVEERDREAREERQRRIEMAGALFLVPTFVVGFYGANTQLPGGGKWSGFVAMLIAMVLLTALALHLVNRSHTRRDEERERREPSG